MLGVLADFAELFVGINNVARLVGDADDGMLVQRLLLRRQVGHGLAERLFDLAQLTRTLDARPDCVDQVPILDGLGQIFVAPQTQRRQLPADIALGG